MYVCVATCLPTELLFHCNGVGVCRVCGAGVCVCVFQGEGGQSLFTWSPLELTSKLNSPPFNPSYQHRKARSYPRKWKGFEDDSR